MKLKLPLLVLCMTAMLPLSLATAAENFNRCIIIEPKDGLSASKVTSITTDSFRHRMGRNDGRSGHRICENKIIHYGHIPEFKNRQIHFVATDSCGTVWVGTYGGLFRYSYDTDSFTEVHLAGKKIHPQSYDFAPDGMIFYTLEGFMKYRYGSDSLSTAYGTGGIGRYDRFKTLNDSTVIAAMNSNGIYRISLNGRPREMIAALSPRDYINDIHIDSGGRLWIAVYKSGLTCLDSNLRDTVACFPQDGDFIRDNIVVDLYESAGILYVTTDGGGILTVDLDSLKTGDFRTVTGYGIPQEAREVNTMLADNEAIWLGTVHHGIVRLDRSPLKFMSEMDFRYKDYTSSSSLITSIAEDSAGGIWVGTDGSGITIHRPGGQMRHFRNLQNEKITSIAMLDDDWMLVSVYPKGLYRCNVHDGSTVYFPIKDEETNERILRQDVIIKLKKKDENTMLIAARDIFIYDISSGKTRQLGISADSNLRIAYTDPMVTFAYNAFEIFRIDSITGKFERLLYTPAGSINQVAYINGRLWVLDSFSLSTMDMINKTLEPVPFKYNGAILSMEHDLQGNIWMTTREKILRLASDSPDGHIAFKIPGKYSHIHFSPDVTLCTGTGDVMFGGHSGMCIINADGIDGSLNEKHRHIELLSVAVNGKDIGYKTKKPENPPYVTVPWNYSSLDIDVCISHEDALNDNDFRYTVHSSRKQNVIYSDNRLSLPVLAPGKYRISVAYADMHDRWTQDTEVLIIHVPTPLRTKIMIAGLAVLLIGLILLGNYYYYHKQEKLKAARLYRHRKEQLTENKIRFLINISHELRTPLTLIYAPLKRLIGKGSSPKGLKHDLTGILSQTKYMMQLINMVLESRKLEEGYVRLNIQTHDLNRWLESAIDEFRTEYEHKDMKLTFKPGNGISGVNYDEGKFHIILSNLLMNAWKYSEPHTEVTVSSSLEEGRVRISISDQGIGIGSADASSIFGRFIQVHKESKGFGLGLSYTKLLVESHPGGTIGAFPNKDKGSTFWFEIPADIPCSTIDISNDNVMPATDNSPEKPASGNSVSGSAEDIDTSEYTVLIAEDEPELLEFLKDELSAYFKTVYTASDGKEAYEKTGKVFPGIIVSDVMMPGMNGYELCRSIKNDIKVSHIPVILLTAMISPADRTEGYKSGADIFLSKPFDIPELMAAIRSILHSRKVIKEKYRQTAAISAIEGTFSSADEQFMTKLDKFIMENISNDLLNAQMIIGHMCMGRANFYKKMKEITGMGIMEYVADKRMKLAEELIRQSDLSISEIAFKVGYADNQYFSRSFRQHFHQSPSSYRKNE